MFPLIQDAHVSLASGTNRTLTFSFHSIGL